MSTKYEKLKIYDSVLQAENCPIIIEQYTLNRDIEKEQNVLCLKMKNIGKDSIKSVELSVECKDINDKITENKTDTYFDLQVGGNEVFGSDIPIALDDSNSCHFKFTIKKIHLEDGSVLENVYELQKSPIEAPAESKENQTIQEKKKKRKYLIQRLVIGVCAVAVIAVAGYFLLTKIPVISARKMYENKEYKSAIKKLDHTVIKNKEIKSLQKKYLNTYVDILITDGKVEDALAFLNENNAADVCAIYAKLGNELYRIGKYEKAFESYKKFDIDKIKEEDISKLQANSIMLAEENRDSLKEWLYQVAMYQLEYESENSSAKAAFEYLKGYKRSDLYAIECECNTNPKRSAEIVIFDLKWEDINKVSLKEIKFNNKGLNRMSEDADTRRIVVSDSSLYDRECDLFFDFEDPTYLSLQTITCEFNGLNAKEVQKIRKLVMEKTNNKLNNKKKWKYSKKEIGTNLSLYYDSYKLNCDDKSYEILTYQDGQTGGFVEFIVEK